MSLFDRIMGIFSTIFAGSSIASNSSYELLNTVLHDSNAFTQGLTFAPDNNTIVYESTGLYGESDVRIVELETGRVIQQRDTASQYFGEGLAYYDTEDSSSGRLIHITWREQQGFVFDADTLEVVEEFRFSTTRNEGWGITYIPDRDQFVVSDGSQYLHFWDREYNEIERIEVTDDSDSPINNLNELEWDSTSQTILSNVWHQDVILRIDPSTGDVQNTYDLRDIRPLFEFGSFNGIALNSAGELWVTGKEWSNMYHIQLID